MGKVGCEIWEKRVGGRKNYLREARRARQQTRDPLRIVRRQRWRGSAREERVNDVGVVGVSVVAVVGVGGGGGGGASETAPAHSHLRRAARAQPSAADEDAAAEHGGAAAEHGGAGAGLL